MSPSGIKFEVGSLSVVGPAYATLQGISGPADESTYLYVIARPDAGHLTGLWTENGQGELQDARDDTGRDLLARGGGSVADGVSSDRKAGLIRISCNVAPAPGATRVLANGHILISTASGVKVFHSALVPLKKASRVSLAGFEFRVGAVEKSPWDNDDRTQIQLLRSTTGRQLRDISRYWFETDKGKRIEHEEAGSSSQGIDDDLEIEERFILGEKPKSLIIAVELWTGRVEQTVKYHVSTTIGCGS
jgi:hypothetical protein